MGRFQGRFNGCAFVLFFPFMAGAATAGSVQPNAGPVEGQGVLQDNDGRTGTWSVQAVLKDGNFTGRATVSLGGTTVTAPLRPSLSYLENGKCHFAFEQDRARASLGGPCTSDSVNGRLDGFIPGLGTIVGEMQGSLRFGTPAAAAVRTGIVPTGKLTCAWWETRVRFDGQPNERQLRPSNMAILVLGKDGSYRTANTRGTFVREGDHVRLTSGAFASAIGQLRPDRSGRPAVYFERDENLGTDGVHLVDPATTACTTSGA